MDNFIDAYGNTLVLVSFVLAVCSAAAIVLLVAAIARLKRPYGGMAELYEREGAKRTLEELLKGVDENRDFIRRQTEETKAILSRLGSCYTGMGIVKYNAFDDIGGMQSFSLCLMTGDKDGFIITNLVGRNSTRGYALEIAQGKPSRELSSEETSAFGAALQSLGA